MIYKEYNPEDNLTWCLNWREIDNKVYYKTYRLNDKGLKYENRSR